MGKGRKASVCKGRKDLCAIASFVTVCIFCGVCVFLSKSLKGMLPLRVIVFLSDRVRAFAVVVLCVRRVTRRRVKEVSLTSSVFWCCICAAAAMAMSPNRERTPGGNVPSSSPNRVLRRGFVGLVGSGSMPEGERVEVVRLSVPYSDTSTEDVHELPVCLWSVESQHTSESVMVRMNVDPGDILFDVVLCVDDDDITGVAEGISHLRTDHEELYAHVVWLSFVYMVTRTHEAFNGGDRRYLRNLFLYPSTPPRYYFTHRGGSVIPRPEQSLPHEYVESVREASSGVLQSLLLEVLR